MKNDENKPNDLRSELEKLRGALTWRPWVGEKYPVEGGLLVIGESNYADETNGIVDYPEGVTPETAVLAAIAVLKPGKLLFVGSDVATTCNKKFLPENAQAHIVNDRKIGSCRLRRGWLQPPNSNRIDFVGIPNPGGAHGFSPADWKDALESPKPGRR